MKNAGISLQALSVKRSNRVVLENISGSFDSGSLTAVIGPNGAGKSTLLKAMMGLLKPSSGKITSEFDPKQIGYLPQAALIDRSIPLTVEEVVAMGAWHQIGAFKKITPSLFEQIKSALDQVGLADLAKQPVEALSSGQFQRVLFARLLLQDARLILLDEPFTGIDRQTTETLLKLIQSWHQAQRTVIAVLHDLNQVEMYFPIALLLAHRVVAWGDTQTVMTPANLQQLMRIDYCAAR